MITNCYLENGEENSVRPMNESGGFWFRLQGGAGR